jgi:hypothetical protein
MRNILPTPKNITSRLSECFVKEDNSTISPIIFMINLVGNPKKKDFLENFS